MSASDPSPSEPGERGPARQRKRSVVPAIPAATTRAQGSNVLTWRQRLVTTLGPLRHGLGRALLDNAALKFVALVLSVTLFILVNTNKEALIGVDVGVVYTMPENRVLTSDKVDQIRVTIKGSWRRVKRFDERSIERINVDLTNLRSGEYRFPEDAIRLPPGLTLLSIKPASVPLRFEPLKLKSVPVYVPTLGRPLHGYKLARRVAKPSQVTIRGAETLIVNTERLAARPLSLDGRSESFTETLSLVRPREPPIFEVIDGTTVEVEATLVEEMSTRTIDKVAIEVRPSPEVSLPSKTRFVVEPNAVTVVLHGSLLAVEGFSGDCVAFVEVYPDDVSGRPRQAAVQIENTPEGVGTEVRPKTITVRTERVQ
ncbi:MAG: CdaR family protein [Proteobacteria bacterium]|nr:CdaR family protein [Pseudomonadota bacterium]